MEFMPLDFFHDSLPSVDVVLLDSILADWDDDCCTKILRNILRSIRQSRANLVISEAIRFSSSSHVDAIGKLALACAVQGRVREPEDVRSLVLAAGFTDCEHVTESPMRFSLIARP
ncbi:methyltransferase [Gardnerella sp. DNF01162]|uniref:methyltransferase n=1 Tax=unclassified Gardnerella TaxID=2628112 RepID=UPI00351876F8